jgi:hypothetical protein
MSKRVYFFGLAITAVALAFLLAEQLFWEPGVSAASVRRIRPGMHLAEVEKILGGRSIIDRINDEQQQATAAPVSRREGELEELRVVMFARQVATIPEVEAAISRFPSSRAWEGQRGYATVEFDERARVKTARFYPDSQVGLLEQFRSWLGW